MTDVICELCPRECVIKDGERGNCRVRENKGGKLTSLVYGKPCAVHIDPVEKKPMYHFLPATTAFSIATAGCNLHCKFCQNWDISQTPPEETRNMDMPPGEVVRLARENNCRSIAYTYSEPTIFYEYTCDTSKLARAKGVNNIWVTAGYINQMPLEKACEYMDGANVDLKGNEEFYKNTCFAHQRPVQDTIKTMVKRGVVVEITNLLVPTLNDRPEDIKELVKWIYNEVGPDIPLHLSRFTPMYKLANLYPTPEKTLFDAAEAATQIGMNYVYVGNIASGGWENTKCPRCRKVIVARKGYLVSENLVKDGKCPFCMTKIYGKWD